MRPIGLVLLGVVVAGGGILSCHSGEGCGTWAGSDGRSTWSECHDGNIRAIECDARPPAGTGAPGAMDAPVKCRCTLGGVVGKTFESADPRQLGLIESAFRTAKDQCGWDIEH
jgi:hypothetical protein